MTSKRTHIAKLALVVGFLALAGALLAARGTPATDYELSIYAGTPAGFWAGVGLAFAAALAVAFATSGRPRGLALLLGGTAATSVAALPILRGYYFHGTADALTHLGYARDLAGGASDPAGLFYPGVHSVAVLLGAAAGIELPRAILFAVAAATVVMLAFVPLVVRRLSADDRAAPIAAFSAFLLFVVHNLGVYVHAHSFSQAALFSVFAVFLLFVYVESDSPDGLGVTGVGVALALVGVALVLFHPQQAANFLLVLGGISVVQFLARRRAPEGTIAGHRSLHVQTVLLGVVFFAWILRFEGWALFNAQRTLGALVAFLSGQPPKVGGAVQSQAASLAAIGSGVGEIFLKLFLVATIYSLLTGGLMLGGLAGRLDPSRPRANAAVGYLGVGAVAISPLVVAYFLGNVAEHYFRHVGFLLVVATVVGALALVRVADRLSGRFSRRSVTVGLVVLFALLLPLSLATVFPSPYYHKQTQHVTQAQMDGYEATFEYNDESLPLAGIREGPWRYSDAIAGVAASSDYDRSVSGENLTDLPAHFEDGGYLVVTDRDRQREVLAYEQLRYSRSAFEALEATPEVDQVVSTGALELYHVG